MIVELLLIKTMVGLVFCAHLPEKKARDIRRSHNHTPKHPRVK